MGQHLHLEIWIADGVYTVTATGQRDSSFVLDRGMDIFGGFSGSETSIGQRNILSNATILSGETGDTSIQSDNVYHVIRIENNTDTLILDGLRITDGYADQIPDTTGAGLFILSDIPYPLVLRNCIFYNLFALSGSAIHNAANTTLNSCTLNDTVMSGSSCAILNSGYEAYLTLKNTNITQTCNPCPEAILNETGATLDIRENVVVEKAE
jgi:hypothetical protein